MADETDQRGQHETHAFQEASSTHPPLDSGCSSDELALYDGLEQLEMSSERTQSPALPAALSTQTANSRNNAANSMPSDELINLEHKSSGTENQAQSRPRSEERDDFNQPPQRPTSPRMASSPAQNSPATELDMYAEQSLRQNPWDDRQDELHNQESSRHTQHDAISESMPDGMGTSETELDAYKALTRSRDEPLRGGGAGPSTPNCHNQQPNFGRRSSSTTSAINEPSHINRTDGEGEPSEPSGRNNSIVLPRWQPDAEVTYCPICSTQFSFFNRKHHCRKCGRVVCATCSQHRITIPHEFIVHPPQDTSPTNSRPSLSQRDTEAASTTCGGTKVRLCNPCVPDPNTLPPPPVRSPGRERRPDRPTYLLSGYGQDQYRISEEALNAFEAMGNQSSPISPLRQRTLSYSTTPIVHRPLFSENRFPQRTSSQHIRNTSYTGPHFTSPPHSQPQSHSQSYGAPPPYMPSNTSRPPPQPRRAIYNSGLLNPSIRPHQGQTVHSLLNLDAPPPSAPPRREIPEEDRCPICREDLMVIAETERKRRVQVGDVEGLSHEENQRVREKHINDCFNQQASILSGRGRRQQSISEGSPMASSAGASGADSMALAGSSSPPPRAKRRVYALFPFKATEKDCIDDAECSICFEDFEPGAKMARLECFCRFHEGCVRSWWEKKPGMCPVHGHNMEGF